MADAAAVVRALAALRLLERVAERSLRLGLSDERAVELARPTVRRAAATLRGRGLRTVS